MAQNRRQFPSFLPPGNIFNSPFMTMNNIADICIPLQVTLEDIYNGNTLKTTYKRSFMCLKCSGTGNRQGVVQHCRQCGGRGHVLENTCHHYFLSASKCPSCNGTGEYLQEKYRCVKCKGAKEFLLDTEINLTAHEGMVDGQTIQIQDVINPASGAIPCNLFVKIQVLPHETFRRSGHIDLEVNVTLSITEALCGFQTVLQHLDGRNLLLKSFPGQAIAPGTCKIIENEGMRNQMGQRGNLYVNFNVEFPTNVRCDGKTIPKLESVLPPRPPVILPPNDEDVEEVELYDFVDEPRPSIYDEHSVWSNTPDCVQQ